MTAQPSLGPISRRKLLLGGGMACLSFSSWGAEAPAVLSGAARPGPLVCLFLRGAADGLSLVVPYADSEYYTARPKLAIAPPGRPGGAMDLDGRFGLHPRLGPLLPAYRAGELAIVHAVGSPHATRSHFEAQDYMQTATPGVVRQDGWLSRCLSAQPDPAAGAGSLRAVALGQEPPLALRGHPGVLSAPRLQKFGLHAPGPLRDDLQAAFEQMYAPPPLTRASSSTSRDSLAVGAGALAAARRLRDLDLAGYAPDHDAVYPKPTQALSEVAALIKAGVGLELAWLDIGGWDTHQNQGGADSGRLAKLLDPWANGLAAFRADLGERFADVLVLVMTEFGRTVRENGSGGTDHGHGSVMFLFGGRVRGGSVYGRFPGLSPAALWEERDLAVTTDFRDVYSEVARRQLGLTELSSILPGYAPGPALGLFST
jgi:uncharacterized protein (DUF1501 family)